MCVCVCVCAVGSDSIIKSNRVYETDQNSVAMVTAEGGEIEPTVPRNDCLVVVVAGADGRSGCHPRSHQAQPVSGSDPSIVGSVAHCWVDKVALLVQRNGNIDHPVHTRTHEIKKEKTHPTLYAI